MKKEARLATLRHRTTVRSRYLTNIAPSNDLQIACLPDLSGKFFKKRVPHEHLTEALIVNSNYDYVNRKFIE
jgi:hypothetical protein